MIFQIYKVYIFKLQKGNQYKVPFLNARAKTIWDSSLYTVYMWVSWLSKAILIRGNMNGHEMKRVLRSQCIKTYKTLCFAMVFSGVGWVICISL